MTSDNLLIPVMISLQLHAVSTTQYRMLCTGSNVAFLRLWLPNHHNAFGASGNPPSAEAELWFSEIHHHPQCHWYFTVLQTYPYWQFSE